MHELEGPPHGCDCSAVTAGNPATWYPHTGLSVDDPSLHARDCYCRVRAVAVFRGGRSWTVGSSAAGVDLLRIPCVLSVDCVHSVSHRRVMICLRTGAMCAE